MLVRHLGRGVGRARAFSGFASLPKHVSIYEVGARDGLQNESTLLDVAERIRFVDELSQTGVAAVEAAAFVNPARVPQMAGGDAIMRGIARSSHVTYPVLVPNLQGFEDGVRSGARAMAVMTAASEAFCRANTNSTIAGQRDLAVAVVHKARELGLPCRGYISTCLGCPFEGAVEPSVVAELARALYEAGCEEIVISDTIGTGTPGDMAAVLAKVTPIVPVKHLAVHCHDTYGQALANILCALQHGVAVVDSSVAGLGGCPFAGEGAAGNVATEDVVYMLHGLGVETGVDFERVVEIGERIVTKLGRCNASKAGVASLRGRRAGASSAAVGAQRQESSQGAVVRDAITLTGISPTPTRHETRDRRGNARAPWAPAAFAQPPNQPQPGMAA